MPEPTPCQIDPELLAILACPACSDRPPLELTDNQQHLKCDKCGRKYPIRDGRIPQLTIDDAIMEDKR